MNATSTTTTGTVTTQPQSPNITASDTTQPTKNPKKGKNEKSSSKNAKKRRGILCCRRKKKIANKKGHKPRKGHKKPAHAKKAPAKKPPVSGSKEQLGDIELVKNTSKPAKKTPLKVLTVDSDDKDEKDDVKKTEKKEEKKTAKKSEKKSENKEDKKEEKHDEQKEKWLKLAKRFVEEDAQIAQADFEQAAGYLPPHVTKHNFVLNTDKNRFSDVVCLDHSRVALHDSSYIHANWVEVDSEKHRRAILTQLPLVDTAVDFWQMVIEQQVKCVLLLLTDEEYNTMGGEFVFPQTQDFLHFPERSIRVGEFKCVEVAKGWLLRVMSIFNGDYRSFIHVHHMKTWAHNSLPSAGHARVKQMWQLQSVLRKYSGPIVYMSLSGCGRAGTFALFEVAHASLHTEAPFDMVKSLEVVRNGRAHAVQNISQFSYVYSLLAEHVLGNGFCKLTEKENEVEENYIQTVVRQLTIE